MCWFFNQPAKSRMAHVMSKFKVQDDEFTTKIGIEYGIKLKNIKRISNNISTASVLIENCNKERIKIVCMRKVLSIHPEFLKEYCHLDPDSAIFRIKQRKRTLYSKFPGGKKCWECGIIPSNVVKIQTCTNCRKGKYCSVECQLSNWDDHKDFCKKLLKLNNEIKSITIMSEVVQDMTFLLGRSRIDDIDILTPLGFDDNFGKQGFDKDTNEIIMKTGNEICRSIARFINVQQHMES